MPMNHLLNNFFSWPSMELSSPRCLLSVGWSNGDRLPDPSLWCELYGGVPRLPREKQRGECIQVQKIWGCPGRL